MPSSRKDQVVVARIGAAHGVKGEVRLRAYTAVPADVAAYGPLTAADGRTFAVVSTRPAPGSAPDVLIARLDGIGDRNAAEALNGLELAVPRAALGAAADDEFFHADLVGLTALSADGARLGTVIAVHNYGAGDLIEIAPPTGATVLVPFTHAAVPHIDVAAGTLTVEPPPGLFDEGDEPQ
jgi:16S rRNA processing protein RimM